MESPQHSLETKAKKKKKSNAMGVEELVCHICNFLLRKKSVRCPREIDIRFSSYASHLLCHLFYP